MTRLAELRGTRELLVNLTLRELRGKYKRSILGWTWSLLNPLSQVVIFTFVFSVILKVQPPPGGPEQLEFPMYLLAGLLAWNFLSLSMTQSMDSLLGNGNLIKKVYFPREVLVAATVGSLLVAFAIELGVMLAILVVVSPSHAGILLWIPVLVLLVALQTVFVFGVSLALSVFNVYFRDMKHLMAILLQALFYSTPIIYTIDLVPARIRRVYGLNPLVRLLDSYRDVLYHVRFPSLENLAYVGVWAGFLLLIGFAIFNRLEGRLAEEV